MRRVRGRSLLLLLAFTLVAPPAFADDDEILRGADLVDTSGKGPDAGQRTARPAPAQQGVEGTAAGGLPPAAQGRPAEAAPVQANTSAYETDLRETVSELQEEVYRLREELDQLKTLRESDRAAFDQRVAEINRQLDQRGARPSQGMAGRVTEIDRGIQEGQRDSQGRLPNDPNYGRDAYGRAPSDPNFGRAPGQTTPAPNGQQGEQKMSWWQKLLLAVLDGVGKGLAAVADRRMSELQNRTDTATNRLNSAYPDRTAETNARVNQAIEEAWRNGRISRAPVNAPIYNTGGADVRVVARGNNGDVVSVNGNLTLLPRVTDETGTHPVINLPLGVGE